LPKTTACKQKAAQADCGQKAETGGIPPDLIEGNEQQLADEALAPAKPPPFRPDERNAQAARAPPVRLDARLLSKREVLAIVGVSYPTLWSMMRANTFPRSRKVGSKSMWVSTEIEAWMATLPRCRLKGDTPEALDAPQRQRYAKARR